MQTQTSSQNAQILLQDVFVEIDGKRICCNISGSGELVFLLSGWGVPSPLADLYILVEELSKTHKTVVLNCFGYGDSDIVEGKTDFASNLNVLTEVIEKIAEQMRSLCSPRKPH